MIEWAVIILGVFVSLYHLKQRKPVVKDDVPVFELFVEKIEDESFIFLDDQKFLGQGKELKPLIDRICLTPKFPEKFVVRVIAKEDSCIDDVTALLS